MGSNNQNYFQQKNNTPSEFLNSLQEKLKNTGDTPALIHEISELRKEIAQLRAELAPVPSLIITGENVLNEFNRLTKNTTK